MLNERLDNHLGHISHQLLNQVLIHYPEAFLLEFHDLDLVSGQWIEFIGVLGIRE